MDARGRNGYRGVQQASSFNGATDGVSASTGGGLPRGFQVRQHDGNDLNNMNVDRWGIVSHLGTNGDTSTRYNNLNLGNTGDITTRNGNLNNIATAGHREGVGVSDQRARRSQARAAQYRSSGGRYMQQVHSRLKSFRRGTSKYKRKIRPSREDILRAADKEAEDLGATPITSVPPLNLAARERLSEERAAVRELLQATTNDARGFIPASKPADALRLFMGNMNSISIYDESRSWKTTRLKETNRRYQTDGMLLQETGVDFRQVPEDLSFPALLGDQDV